MMRVRVTFRGELVNFADVVLLRCSLEELQEMADEIQEKLEPMLNREPTGTLKDKYTFAELQWMLNALDAFCRLDALIDREYMEWFAA